jgi:hypothetical protein
LESTNYFNAVPPVLVFGRCLGRPNALQLLSSPFIGIVLEITTFALSCVKLEELALERGL